MEDRCRHLVTMTRTGINYCTLAMKTGEECETGNLNCHYYKEKGDNKIELCLCCGVNIKACMRNGKFDTAELRFSDNKNRKRKSRSIRS